MRASPLVLTVVLACAHGKRGGLRQKARRVEAVEAAEAAAAAAAGEAIDPLGYYRYRWQQPTDTCGTELHADYDGTRGGVELGAGPKPARRWIVRIHV